MAGKFAAEVIVRMRADTRQAQRGFRSMDRGFGRLFQFTQRLRAGLLGMNTMLMGSGAVMVGAGLAARATVRNYERLSTANARLRSILVSGGDSLRTYRMMTDHANVSAREWGFGLGEASQAMGTLLETGVGAHATMRYFGTAARFARASGTDLDRTMRVIVDTMRQFDDQSEEGAERLAATMTVASRITATSVDEMQQSLRYAGVEMSTLGFNATEVASALGALSQVGLRGTTAGTRLRGAMLALTRITDRSRDIMRQYNLDHTRLDRTLYDETGSLRSLVDVSDQLTGIMSDLPTEYARTTLATALFGRRARAAGDILSGLHERSEDFRMTLVELSDEEEVVRRMNEAADQAMRGFGAQMRLAKVAAEDLTIAFADMLLGQTELNREGFGTFLRDMAIAIRYADESNIRSSEQRDQYMALTKAQRLQGREWRRTLEGLAELLRILGRAGLALGRFVGEYPRLTVAIVGVGSVLRPLISMLLLLKGTVVATTFASIIGQLGSFVVIATATSTVLSGIALGLAAFGGLALADPLGYWISGMNDINGNTQDAREEYRRLGEESDRWFTQHVGGWATQIPILNNAIRTVGRLTIAFGEAWDAGLAVWQQQRTFAAAERAGAEEAITGYAGRIGRMARYEGYSREEVRAAAAQRMTTERFVRLAAQIRSMGETQEGATERFRDMMRQRGASERETEAMTERFRRAVHGLGDNYREITRQAFEAGISHGESADAVLEFSRALRDAQATVRMMGTTASPITGTETAGFRTRAVTASGAAEREALSRALIGSPEILGGMSQQAGATPQSQQTEAPRLEADLRIESPLTIDGREVARAVGRHVLQIDQRRGASLRPGSRRRVAESGVR